MDHGNLMEMVAPLAVMYLRGEMTLDEYIRGIGELTRERDAVGGYEDRGVPLADGAVLNNCPLIRRALGIDR